MDRWTMEDLERTDDITFAIAILDERRSKLTPYSPLGLKLQQAQNTLRTIREERDRYLESITAGAAAPEEAADETDL